MRVPRTIASRLGVVAAALAVAIGIASVLAIAPSIASERVTANDFVQDYVAARALADGRDPYEPTDRLAGRYLPEYPFFDEVSQPVPHPPALLLVFRPLGGLSVRTATAAWLIVTALLYVGATFVAARALGATKWVSFALGVGSLAVPVVQKDLQYGQSNALLLAAIVAGWLLGRSGRDGAAGVALGVAAAFKLFPLLLLFPLWRAGRRRAASSMTITFIGVSVAASALVGFGAAAHFVTRVAPDNANYWAPAPMNLSASAIPARWLTENEWFEGAPAPLLARLLAVAIILAIAVLAWRRGSNADPIASTIPLMLLASPLTWEFSLPLLLPIIAIRIRTAVVARTPPGALWMVCFAIVAIGVPPGLPEPESVGAASQLLGYALPLYGVMGLAWLARPRPDPGPKPGAAR